MDNDLAHLRTANSALVDRAEFVRRTGYTYPSSTGNTFARDIYATLGYLRNLKPRDYREKYERGGIAERIVEAYPDAAWRDGVTLVEDENPENTTAFEAAAAALAKQLGMWATLRRADTMAGLGRFSLVLIGAPGPLDEPLPDNLPAAKLAGLWPYSEEFATVDKLVSDTSDPRFGLPETYRLAVQGRALAKGTQHTISIRNRKGVHWSRIVHVAEGLTNDEVYGKPRLRAIWNYLDDIEKVHGAGAEAFWRNANVLNQVDLDPEVTLNPEELESLQDEIDEVRHDMRDWLRTKGLTLTRHGANTANFASNLDAVLTLISGTTGIPKRIMLGSERGELASTQDRSNWAERIEGRRTEYLDPHVVRQLIDRLIEHRTLPTPRVAEGYTVFWNGTHEATEGEKLDQAQTMAETNAKAGALVYTVDEIRAASGRPPLAEVASPDDADTNGGAGTGPTDTPPATGNRAAAEFVDTPAPEEGWQAVHDAADATIGLVDAAIQDVFDEQQAALSMSAVETALAAGDASAAQRAFDQAAPVSPEGHVAITEALRAALAAGGQNATDAANRNGGFTVATRADRALRALASPWWVPVPRAMADEFHMVFDAQHPEVIAWAEEHGTGMVLALESTTNAALNASFAEMIGNGMTVQQQAREIRDAIGLTARQETAVGNLRLELANAKPGTTITRFQPDANKALRSVPGFRARVPIGGPTDAWVNKQITKYRSMQTNWRARQLARDATMRSASEGQRLMWMQARAKGLLTELAVRFRITTPDDRLCQECESVDGEEAKLDEPYDSTGDMNPQVHSMCRCSEAVDTRSGKGGRRVARALMRMARRLLNGA